MDLKGKTSDPGGQIQEGSAEGEGALAPSPEDEKAFPLGAVYLAQGGLQTHFGESAAVQPSVH